MLCGIVVEVSSSSIHTQSWVRTIVSTGKWYLVSSFLTKGLALLLLPIYTRYLSPAEYGILNSLSSIGQFLPILISLYLDSAFGRYFHEDKTDPVKLRRLFSTTYWFVVIWGGSIVLLALLSAPWWVDYFLRVPFSYVWLTFVPALLLQVGQLGTVYLRQSLDSKLTTLVEVGAAVLSMVVTLPLLIIADMGVMARLIGGLVPAVVIFAFYSIYFRRIGLLEFNIDGPTLRKSLVYSLPLLPSLFAGWLGGQSDRLIVGHYDSLAAVGLYSLAGNLALLLYVIQDAVTQVVGPLSMSGLIHDKERTLEKMTLVNLQLWVLMLAACLGLSIFSTEIVAVVAAKNYGDAAGILGILGFAYVLSCQYRNMTTIVSLHNRMWLLTLGGFIQGGSSLLINFLFVPTYGYIAAAFAFTGSTLIFVVWLYYWCWRLERFQLMFRPMLLSAILFAAIVASVQWLSNFTGLWLMILIKSGVLALVVLSGWIYLRTVR